MPSTLIESLRAGRAVLGATRRSPARGGDTWLCAQPKFVIPFHYGTLALLKGTPQEYVATLGQTSTKVFAINPGDKQEF